MIRSCQRAKLEENDSIHGIIIYFMQKTCQNILLSKAKSGYVVIAMQSSLNIITVTQTFVLTDIPGDREFTGFSYGSIIHISSMFILPY